MFFFKVLDEPLTFYGIVRSFSDMSEVFLVSDAKIHLFILIAPLQKTTQLLFKKPLLQVPVTATWHQFKHIQMLKHKDICARKSVEQTEDDNLDQVITGVRIIVEKASGEITETVKNEVGKAVEMQTGHITAVDNGIEKLSNGQTIVLGAVDEMVNFMKDEVMTANENAKKHERISYQVRGQLGAAVSKRRKADLEEIAALKRENMALTQSIIEKDKVAAADMASLKAEMAAMRAGFVVMKASFDALLVGVVNKYKSSRRRV